MKTATGVAGNPTSTTNVSKHDGAFHRVARVAATFTVLLGCSVLLGWAFDIGVLKTVRPGLVSMKANSALAFVLAGLSLTFQLEPHSSRRSLTIARGCAFLAASIGLLTLLEYLFDRDFGIDQWLVAAAPDAGFPFAPGRMAPNTALSFVLVGAALSLLDAGSRSLRAVPQACAVVTFLAGFTAIVEYAYHAPVVIAGAVEYTTIAAHTAVGFVVLSTGVLACRPHRDLMAILAQDNLAGSSVRWLLPIVSAIPFAFGWARLQGEHAGLYGTEFGTALTISAITVVLVSVVLWNARVQGRAFETREQALRDQRASEEHSRLLVESVTDYAMFMLNPDGTIASWNPGAERLKGYHAGEVVGRHVSLLYSEEDRLRHQPELELRQAVEADRFEDEAWRVRKDDSRFWAHVMITAVRDTAGNLLGFAKVVRDFTERRRAEEELRRSESRKSAILNSALDAVVSIDSRGHITDFNAAAEKMFGHRAVDVIGKPMAELLVPPALREAHRRGFARFLATGEGTVIGRVVEMFALRADGSEFPVELAIAQVEGQEPPFFTASIRDITERKRSVERFQLAIEASPTGMIMIDRHGHIVLINAQIEKLFGYQRAELLGQSIEMLVPEPLRSGHSALRQAFSKDPSARPMGAGRNLFGLRKDGSEVPIEIALNPMETSAGSYVLSSVVDITERKKSAERFRLSIEASPIGMILADRQGSIVLANAQVEKMFGHDSATLIGQPVEILLPERFRAGHPKLRTAFVGEPQARAMGAGRDLFGLRKDGTEVPVEIGLTPMETPEGGFVLTSIVDISERKRTEAERSQLLSDLRALTKDLERRVEARTKDLAAAHETLSRSEVRFRALFDDSPISLWEQDFSDAVAYLHQLGAQDAADLRARVMSDPDVVATAADRVEILAVNQASLKLFEAATETELSQSLPQIFRSLQFATFRDELLAFLDGKTSFEAETTTYTLKGNRNTISLRLSVLPGHEKTWSKVVVSIFDMTAHKEAEDKIRASLQEKEVLLKEIHHRVKNNLQVISSLLNLQARHLPDPGARRIFAESQNRVQAIALVHEKLYRSGDLSQIPFDEYIQTLVSNLCHSLDAAERDISPRVEIGGIRLAVDVAIPCGLIINELVTNSLKHAFPNRRGGCIQVLLRRDGSGRLELIVQDDGVGLPSGLDPRQTPSLGLDLVFTFAEQLGATVDVRRHPGTAFSFVFPQNG
jgi:PAS domain S-box-containing protein